MKSRRVLFTDGEGPIVTNDFAFEITARFNKQLFTLISVYDDYLSVFGPKNYEAGDTLALIIPFFIAHGIHNRMLSHMARRATISPGASAYLKQLMNDRWTIRIISTAYTPLWKTVGASLGIPIDHIASTDLDLSRLRHRYASSTFTGLVIRIERDLISVMDSCLRIIHNSSSRMTTIDVFRKNKTCVQIRKRLDAFFWHELPTVGYESLSVIQVIGGKRKVNAAKEFARLLRIPLKYIAYVGDSITDVELFKALNRIGGLTVALNANRFALEHAQFAVATPDMRAIRPLLDSWESGGFDSVKSFVRENKKQSNAHYAYVNTRNKQSFESLVSQHAKMRKTIRADAAALG